MEKIETHKQNAAIVGSNREVIIVVLEYQKTQMSRREFRSLQGAALMASLY
jgi:hypothetical protein